METSRYAGAIHIPVHFNNEEKRDFLGRVAEQLLMLSLELEKGETHEGTIRLYVPFE